MFRRCLLALAATLLALTCTLPVAGRAQIEGELVPYAGLYLPTTSVMYQGHKQQASPTLGARVTVWFLRRAGIEGTVNYTPSNLTGPMPVSPGSAYVVARSAKLLVRLNGPDANTVFHLGAGPARVRYGGPAYCGCNDVYLQASGSTFDGWVAVAGALFNPSRLISLRLDVEDYEFRAYFACRNGGHSPGVCNYGFPYTYKRQTDLVVSLGAALSVGGRRSESS